MKEQLTFAKLADLYKAANNEDKAVIEHFFQRFLSAFEVAYKQPPINDDLLSELVGESLNDADMESPQTHLIYDLLDNVRQKNNSSAGVAMGAIVQILEPSLYPHEDNYRNTRDLLKMEGKI